MNSDGTFAWNVDPEVHEHISPERCGEVGIKLWIPISDNGGLQLWTGDERLSAASQKEIRITAAIQKGNFNDLLHELCTPPAGARGPGSQSTFYFGNLTQFGTLGGLLQHRKRDLKFRMDYNGVSSEAELRQLTMDACNGIEGECVMNPGGASDLNIHICADVEVYKDLPGQEASDAAHDDEFQSGLVVPAGYSFKIPPGSFNSEDLVTVFLPNGWTMEEQALPEGVDVGVARQLAQRFFRFGEELNDRWPSANHKAMGSAVGPATEKKPDWTRSGTWIRVSDSRFNGWIDGSNIRHPPERGHLGYHYGMWFRINHVIPETYEISRADIWSLAIILYQMIFNIPLNVVRDGISALPAPLPSAFKGADGEDLINMTNFYSLIQGMLKIDPYYRWSMDEIKNSAFYKRAGEPDSDLGLGIRPKHGVSYLFDELLDLRLQLDGVTNTHMSVQDWEKRATIQKSMQDLISKYHEKKAQVEEPFAIMLRSHQLQDEEAQVAPTTVGGNLRPRANAIMGDNEDDVIVERGAAA